MNIGSAMLRCEICMTMYGLEFPKLTLRNAIYNSIIYIYIYIYIYIILQLDHGMTTTAQTLCLPRQKDANMCVPKIDNDHTNARLLGWVL